MPSFAALAPTYAKLWAELVPTAAHVPDLEKIGHGLIAHKATYQTVSQAVWSTPTNWWVVALIDQMEGGGGARTHLWNGDPLTHFTVNVPAGMPLVSVVGHGPPFTFEESAVPALHHDALDKVTVWSAAAVGFYFEQYNGWGYLTKPIVSPYLASWSNKYTSGKYVSDHVYDPNAVSGQPGALTILKVLMTLDSSIVLAGESTPASAPTKPAQPAPIAPPKEITPVATPIPAGLSAILVQLSTVTNILETAVSYLPMVAPFFPPLAPMVPFIPFAQAALATLAKIEAAGGDPTQTIQIIETDFAGIKAAFNTAMGHPLVVATTAAVAKTGP